MAVVIAACYLVAFLVPVWLMLIARMDAGNAGTWRSSAAATAVAAAVMMGFFTGSVLILVDDKTERIVSMIAGLLIWRSEQALSIQTAIDSIYRTNLKIREAVLIGIVITVFLLISTGLVMCCVAAFKI